MRRTNNTRSSTEGKYITAFRYFGFEPINQSGNEYYGDCIFCGRQNKLYVNKDTGQWRCMSGHCGLHGNHHTFFEEWYKMQREWSLLPENRDSWQELAQDRQIRVGALKRGELVYDGYRWFIPVRNASGTIVTFRYWRRGLKLRALGGMDLGLYNLQELAKPDNRDKIVIICEGEYDAIALIDFFLRHGIDRYVVVGLPGSDTFKSEWVQYLQRRKIIVAGDNDTAGQKCVWRVISVMNGAAQWIKQIIWPDGFPDNYDMRDLATSARATPDIFEEMIGEPVIQPDAPAQRPNVDIDSFPPLSDPARPKFSDVEDIFNRWLYMTPGMSEALKLVFATVLSNQIDGVPVWLHIAGAPGIAKTEILRAADAARQCIMRSTITASSLVSGWAAGSDPSLIPQLDGKVFLLKDFTEVLRANKNEKDAVYNILRGAFDGEVSKSFGNNVHREWKVKFSTITGVTKAVYADANTMLGERFLIYHIAQEEATIETLLYTALDNGGHETAMALELAEISKRFLETKIETNEIPELPAHILRKLVALTQLVAMLRAAVEKDIYRDKLLYMPEYEVGTRPGKQLKKLLQGLALLHPDEGITDDDYKLALRVGLSSCIGFNLEIVRRLVKSEDGELGPDLSDKCNLPYTTLRDQIEDLCNLGVVTRERSEPTGERGAPPIRYQVRKRIKDLWKAAGFEDHFADSELAEITVAASEAAIEARRKRPGSHRFGEELEPSVKASRNGHHAAGTATAIRIPRKRV